MSRRSWIFALVGAGVVLAIVIGVLSTRNEPPKADAAATLCSSLKRLGSSVKTLTSLDPSTASKSAVYRDVYQSDVDAIQDDWNQVKSDAQAVRNALMGDLDSAWDDFSAAVKKIRSDASTSDALNDVTSSAQQLASTAQSAVSSMSCPDRSVE